MQIWRSSPECAAVKGEVEDQKKNAKVHEGEEEPREFATNRYLKYYLCYVFVANCILGGTSLNSCTFASILFSGETQATSELSQIMLGYRYLLLTLQRRKNFTSSPRWSCSWFLFLEPRSFCF